MRVNGVIGGAGVNVAVSVGIGEISGLIVTAGVPVDPLDIGTVLHAVNMRERIKPKIVQMRFMACLYW